MAVGVAPDPLDDEITEPSHLVELYQPLLEELQDGEKPNDDLHRVVDDVIGELPERRPPTAGQPVQQLVDGESHAGGHRRHMVHIHVRHRPGSHRPVEGLSDVGGCRLLEEIGRQSEEVLLQPGDPRTNTGGGGHEPLDGRRSVLERLGFEEPRQQQVPFLPEGDLLIEFDLGVLGQQPAHLEIDQGGSDQEELRGDVEIGRLHASNLVEIGVDDVGEGDLVEVDLVVQDEVQQEVEGAVEPSRFNSNPRCRARLGVANRGDRLSPSLIGIRRFRREKDSRAHRFDSTLHAMPAQRPRVFSGIQPSGSTHLGNYLGALRNWERLQHDADTVYCIVDLHALTLPKDPGEVAEGTLNMTRMLLAVGLDPERCTLFVQSHVHEHAELGWLIQCVTGFGELRRMTQFKDKADRLGGLADEGSGASASISAGLFTYPALQAADILLYDTDIVPVGDDQRQHVELTRDVAIRINSRYGEGTVVVPEHRIPPAGARVMNLQYPHQKMSKSVGSELGTIEVLDSPDRIEKKIKRAVTDNDAEVRYDTDAKPGVSNLLSILAASTDGDPAKLAGRYGRYGPLKADTAEAVIELLAPVRERYRLLSDDDVRDALALGARKAGSVAGPVMQRIKDAIGLLSPAQ